MESILNSILFLFLLSLGQEHLSSFFFHLTYFLGMFVLKMSPPPQDFWFWLLHEKMKRA